MVDVNMATTVATTINVLAPKSLEEALASMALATRKPYGGGTDVMLKETAQAPFIFLHQIAELKELKDEGSALHIGAALTYDELLSSALTPQILKEAVSQIAAPAIRNAATLGGNICNASPKADGALICMVADCELVLSSVRGTRIVPIKDFYVGRGKTVLKSDELLVKIIMPTKHLDNYCFEKVGARKALAISRVSFAGLLSIKGAVVEHLALAFGAVEDVIVRPTKLDSMLIGKTVSEAVLLVDDYLAELDKAINPIRGRVSATYRKDVCLNLAKEFLQTKLK